MVANVTETLELGLRVILWVAVMNKISCCVVKIKLTVGPYEECYLAITSILLVRLSD